MKNLWIVLVLASLGLGLCAPAASQDPNSSDSGAAAAADPHQPKVVPLHRPEMKQLLEQLKQRQPRLPLPAGVAGEQTVNNGRMRATYLPESWTGPRPAPAPRDSAAAPSGGRRSTSRNADAAMTLDNTFKVRLFWITSRVNNCHYCLGHQEMKLARAGMAEDDIARLDCEWSAFPANEQAAFAFTQKLTEAPHEIGAADIERLRKYFNDAEIIEIAQTVASYNSTNRWTDSLGIPQDQTFSDETAVLDSPTSPAFQGVSSQVVSLQEKQRPPLESRPEVEAALAACGQRTPLVQLPAATAVNAALTDVVARNHNTNFARALALFPTTAKRQVESWDGIVLQGELPAATKAQIVWAAARENRAWYVVGHAHAWLRRLGCSDEQIFAIDQGNAYGEPHNQLAIEFARKLTSHPRTIVDHDIAQLREKFSDREVAEIVYVTCFANYLSRLANSLGLPLEASSSPQP